MIFLDEQQWRKHDADREYFKTVVTEEEIRLNAKFKPMVMVPNTVNLIQASQYSSHIEHMDRRTVQFHVNAELAGTLDTLEEKACAEIHRTDLCMLAKVLHSVDVSEFRKRTTLSPITRATMEEQIRGLDPMSVSHSTTQFWLNCKCRRSDYILQGSSFTATMWSIVFGSDREFSNAGN